MKLADDGVSVRADPLYPGEVLVTDFGAERTEITWRAIIGEPGLGDKRGQPVLAVFTLPSGDRIPYCGLGDKA
ncbi:hypothetical protein GR01_23420 [Mycobacteroides chelonae]|nr:hypothetical protein GR01_23420 [Mycobacteroides chelonae]ANB00997.1 hypothetical protein BB28_24405 [Mycobacteroides chelonae CCUG 47445]